MHFMLIFFKFFAAKLTKGGSDYISSDAREGVTTYDLGGLISQINGRPVKRRSDNRHCTVYITSH